MLKNAPRYIGVTGFMSVDEVFSALRTFRSKNTTGARFMVGVFAGGKTFRGEKDECSNRFPQDGGFAKGS